MNKRLAEPFDRLLATDLDGTLVGDDQACLDLFAFLKQHLGHTGLVYVTGRHEASARELIAAMHLEKPDYLVTDVGTRIFHYSTGQADENWDQQRMAHWFPDKIRSVASRFDALSEQDLPVTCRVSFTSRRESVVRRFREALAAEKIPHVFIYSSGHDVDVLPEGSGKGAAIQYLIPKISASDGRVLVAGDSGNDRSMVQSGYPAVIVANAQPELKAIPADPLVYLAKKCCAGGILEAWQHFYGS